MDFEVRDVNQKVLKFEYENTFKIDDFYISKSNEHIYKFLNIWPKWEKNFLNISGEKYSGKTHLIKIFLKKNSGIKIEAKSLDNEKFKEVKLYQNVVLENFDQNIDEKLLYAFLNFIEQENKYLILTSTIPIVEMSFDLDDLKSRSKNFILQVISKPDDELIFALILKNLSDRQIFLDKKLINYIIKRIDRSYGKIFDLIYKIDELSLKKKRSIDLKIIKEVLED
jgi:chromosomal replication initiation ATPase DnaA